jgi:hypothetical protein
MPAAHRARAPELNIGSMADAMAGAIGLNFGATDILLLYFFICRFVALRAEISPGDRWAAAIQPFQPRGDILWLCRGGIGCGMVHGASNRAVY